MIIFGIDIRVYFLLFLLYSFFGWLMEVICKLIQYKKFIDRGFLIGPYCPIYGTGAVLITILLKKYTNDPITLFIMVILVCGILEYLTSYLMEKIFHARWWDYSQKKFNINGRVCLDTIIPFGLLGMFIIKVSNPFLIGKIESLPEIWINVLFWMLLILYLVDNIVSTKVISYVGRTTKEVGKDLDNTEEITKKVKELLLGKSILYRRLINAYPKIQSIKVKIKEKKEEIKRQVEEQKNEIKENVKKQKKDIREKIDNIKEDKK
ncbi:MAG: putative ABC transporter permease [Clostridia bacterium]|nr:putative ABC transporter permease [Clostridia bacterium]